MTGSMVRAKKLDWADPVTPDFNVEYRRPLHHLGLRCNLQLATLPFSTLSSGERGFAVPFFSPVHGLRHGVIFPALGQAPEGNHLSRHHHRLRVGHGTHRKLLEEPQVGFSIGP